MVPATTKRENAMKLNDLMFATREAARNVARNINNRATGATVKAPVKGDNGWIFPGLKHADNKGTLSLKK